MEEETLRHLNFHILLHVIRLVCFHSLAIYIPFCYQPTSKSSSQCNLKIRIYPPPIIATDSPLYLQILFIIINFFYLRMELEILQSFNKTSIFPMRLYEVFVTPALKIHTYAMLLLLIKWQVSFPYINITTNSMQLAHFPQQGRATAVCFPYAWNIAKKTVTVN